MQKKEALTHNSKLEHQASIIEEYEMNHSLEFEMEQEQYAKEVQKEKGLSLPTVRT